MCAPIFYPDEGRALGNLVRIEALPVCEAVKSSRLRKVCQIFEVAHMDLDIGHVGVGQQLCSRSAALLVALKSRRVSRWWFNEIADKWAKLAADEPDAHGVEWFSTRNSDGTITQRHFPLPRSLANVKREASEKKWRDAKSWTRKMLGRTGNRKYNTGPAKSRNRILWSPRQTSAKRPASTSSKLDTA